MKTMSVKLSEEEYELVMQAKDILLKKGTEHLLKYGESVEWDGTIGGAVGVSARVLIRCLEGA